MINETLTHVIYEKDIMAQRSCMAMCP